MANFFLEPLDGKCGRDKSSGRHPTIHYSPSIDLSQCTDVAVNRGCCVACLNQSLGYSLQSFTGNRPCRFVAKTMDGIAAFSEPQRQFKTGFCKRMGLDQFHQRNVNGNKR